MNIIVLVKQVPDISNIPDDAWDREKGTLRRGLLEAVLNPLDLQALTFACRMREAWQGGRIVCLTMGPPQAKDMLEDCLSRGADEAVLLTDMKFAGADTPATAYALSQAVRKIVKDMFGGQEYVIVSGMQSVDGDTAQVPPQVAEELGMDHIAYAKSFTLDAQRRLLVRRIGPAGMDIVQPARYPVLITVADGMDPVGKSFRRARQVRYEQKILRWNARTVEADEQLTGFKGSRTWVSCIFSSAHHRTKPCQFIDSTDKLLDCLERDFQNGSAESAQKKSSYVLGAGSPTYTGGVWIYAEQEADALSRVSLELLGQAQELGRVLGEKVGAVLVGDHLAHLVPQLFSAGADTVYLIEHPRLKNFSAMLYKKAMAPLILDKKPQIFLFGATPSGRELAPRVAYATGCGLTADCTALEIGDHAAGGERYVAILKQTRPALGGNIMATIMTKDSICQMATVRPGVFAVPSCLSSRQGECIRMTPLWDADDVVAQVLLREPPLKKAGLDQAGIIVSGGRGLGSRGNFEKSLPPFAEALSRWLKARVEIGASRMAVEDGFAGHERQVGQTGQTVRPRFYIAVGISGAVQHLTGMQNSGLILSINKDPHAKIFSYSDYGIVGSWETELPRLVAAIQRRAI